MGNKGWWNGMKEWGHGKKDMIVWKEWSNDPLYGHLWVDRVMEPLTIIIVHEKVWHPHTWLLGVEVDDGPCGLEVHEKNLVLILFNSLVRSPLWGCSKEG